MLFEESGSERAEVVDECAVVDCAAGACGRCRCTGVVIPRLGRPGSASRCRPRRWRAQFPRQDRAGAHRQTRQRHRMGRRRRAVVECTRQPLHPARHAWLLLARALPGRRSAIRDLPRRLRRPHQLGHGLAAHRLERPRLRCLRYRCQSRAHPCLLQARQGSGCQRLDPHCVCLGRNPRRAPVCRRQGGRTRRLRRALRQWRFARLRRRTRPVRPRRPRDVAAPGAEPLQLPARQRLRRDPHLRPHARRQRRRCACAPAGTHHRTRHRCGRAIRRLPASLRLGQRPRAACIDRSGHPHPQGGIHRRTRSQAMDVEGHRRHRRNHLARRLQPLAAAGAQRLFPAARLEHLCRRRQGTRPHPAGRTLQPHRTTRCRLRPGHLRCT